MNDEFDYALLPKRGKGSLRDLIDRAKLKLQLPELMAWYDDESAAMSSARCPFHSDAHPSFSIYRGEDGKWRWKCFAGCGEGDEIDYIREKENCDNAEAIRYYLELAERIPDELAEKESEDDDEEDNERDWEW